MALLDVYYLWNLIQNSFPTQCALQLWVSVCLLLRHICFVCKLMRMLIIYVSFLMLQQDYAITYSICLFGTFTDVKLLTFCMIDICSQGFASIVVLGGTRYLKPSFIRENLTFFFILQLQI